MYMRMIGYPGEQISILTTYNGQKHLIRDVIHKRCGNNPLIGRPHKVPDTISLVDYLSENQHYSCSNITGYNLLPKPFSAVDKVKFILFILILIKFVIKVQ